MTTLDEFLSEVVMTGHYLAEPPRRSTELLHDAEMKCLKIISSFGPLQMHEIATMMHATKPRASQLVMVLEKYKYATKTTGPDKRVRLVSVTSEGQSIVDQTREKYKVLASQIEQKIGSAKTRQLCELLSEIVPLSELTHNSNKETT